MNKKQFATAACVIVIALAVNVFSALAEETVYTAQPGDSLLKIAKSVPASNDAVRLYGLIVANPELQERVLREAAKRLVGGQLAVVVYPGEHYRVPKFVQKPITLAELESRLAVVEKISMATASRTNEITDLVQALYTHQYGLLAVVSFGVFLTAAALFLHILLLRKRENAKKTEETADIPEISVAETPESRVTVETILGRINEYEKDSNRTVMRLIREFISAPGSFPFLPSGALDADEVAYPVAAHILKNRPKNGYSFYPFISEVITAVADQSEEARRILAAADAISNPDDAMRILHRIGNAFALGAFPAQSYTFLSPDTGRMFMGQGTKTEVIPLLAMTDDARERFLEAIVKRCRRREFLTFTEFLKFIEKARSDVEIRGSGPESPQAITPESQKYVFGAHASAANA